MALIQSLVERSKYNIKCPYSMIPEGICVHNTANDASAESEVAYMKSNNKEISFHIAIDDNNAIQCLPLDRNAWAAGDGLNGNGNRKYIHIEICYSKSGGTRFNNAEKRAAKEIAALLIKYGWGISHVKKHQDFSRKYCPHRTLDMGWDRFLNMVQLELISIKNESTITKPSVQSVNYVYRVVCGSFSSKEKALIQKASLKTIGYESFITVVNSNGSSMYRVVCGSFNSKEKALIRKNELVNKGFNSFVTAVKK